MLFAILWQDQFLSVNALEFCHARGPPGFGRLAEDLICAPASQANVERIFSVCGRLCSGRRSAMVRSIEMRACLKLNQSAERNILSTVIANMTDLCRNSLNEQN